MFKSLNSIFGRYVLVTFLKNYALSLFVLIGMFITLDIVLNFDDFFVVSQGTAQTTTSSGLATAFHILFNLLDYYLYKSILVFVQLSAVIPVVAAAFTLLRMTRSNETIATLACGIPLLVTAMPIIFASVAITFGVVGVQEAIIPAIIPKLIRSPEDVGADTRRSFPVKALEDGKGNLLVASLFNPSTLTAPASMVELDLIERDDSRQPASHVRAERAIWEPSTNRWRLTHGIRYRGLSGNGASRSTAADTPEPLDYLPTTLSPEEVTLYRSRQYVDLLSLSRIDELLAQPRGYGNTDLLRVKHFRIAQWINNNILLWLIIPCVMTREPRTLKTGGAFLLLIAGAYMGSIFVCQQLAGTVPHNPTIAPYWTAMMALTPPAVFFLGAIFALDKIKT